MKIIIAESLKKGMPYMNYREMVTELLSEGRSTGSQQSEALVHYTELNNARMDRLDKKAVIPEDNVRRVFSLKGKYTWLVISESWCGDAAQILPVMNKLATQSPNIKMKIVLRDENPELMDMFLSNGSRSIPKLIVLNEDLSVLTNWGPRPEGASKLMESYKSQYGKLDDTAKKELHLWYAHDKGAEVQNEITDLMVRLEVSI